MSAQQFTVTPIGWVESPLSDPSRAPKQGSEGAPDAWMRLEQRFSEGIRDPHHAAITMPDKVTDLLLELAS